MIALAFVAGLAAHLLRLPPCWVSWPPALPSTRWASSAATLDTIANLGVTLLLFTIGLKLDIRTLMRGEVWGAATCTSSARRCCWPGCCSS
jgi:glutathione-regulated potassium-efflux system ancillary protein KefC